MKERILFRVFVTVLLILTVWSGVAIWRSGRAGKMVFRRQAEEALVRRAELEINREFDALGVPYLFEPCPSGIPSQGKRVLTMAGRTLEVEIDSLKESQGLYSLGRLGNKAFLVEVFSSFPLDSLQTGWQGALGGDIPLLLVLTSTSPMADSTRVERAGDLSVAREDFLIGTYYLDDFYTMRLAAYARVGFWPCVGWGSPGVAVPLAGWLLAWLAFGGWSLHARLRGRKSDPPASDVTQSVWKFGNLVCHKDSMTVTCNGCRVDITPQELKLFWAFLSHGGCLSEADIVHALGWSSTDENLKAKKRKAISHLRKRLLEQDERVRIMYEGKVYKMFIDEGDGNCLESNGLSEREQKVTLREEKNHA